MPYSVVAGRGEIGGNCIEVRGREARVLLDLGMPYSRWSQFYSEPFITPKDVDELLALGVAPDVEGLYPGKKGRRVDAVFISHPHFDHSLLASLIDRKIEVYVGETALRILEARLETFAHKKFYRNFEGLKLKTFRTGDEIAIGDVRVEPVHVDHSTPGSYAFLVETADERLAYSGDYRLHGSARKLTEDFVERARTFEPDVMVTEGTNFFDVDALEEGDVESKIRTLIEGVGNKLVLASFSPLDVDRFRTFCKVAEKVGRALYLPPKFGYILSALKKNARLKLPEVGGDLVKLYKVRRRAYYGSGRFRSFERDEIDFVADEDMTPQEARRSILVMPVEWIPRMSKLLKEVGSVFILSHSEPVSEEREIEYERLKHWMEWFGIPTWRIHASGHIYPHHLKYVIDAVSPKAVDVVHSEHEGALRKFLGLE